MPRRAIVTLALGILVLLGLAWPIVRADPHETTWAVDEAQVRLSTDDARVWLPGEAVQITWQATGVAAVTVFPISYQGIEGAPGVRDIYFDQAFEGEPHRPDEARGGTRQVATAPDDVLRGEFTGSVALAAEPKLRASLPDGRAYAVQMGLQPYLLRADVWFGLLLGAALLGWGRAQMAPSGQRWRGLVWFNGAVYAAYALIILHFGPADFVRAYLPEALVLGAHMAVLVALMIVPGRAAEVGAARWPWWGVLPLLANLVYVRFGFETPEGLAPYLFLPLLLVTPTQVPWGKLPQVYSQMAKGGGLAWPWLMAFAGAYILRDLALLGAFSVLVAPDTISYLEPASTLFNGTDPITNRTLPYLLLLNITDALNGPLGAVLVQIGLAALASTALVAVLAREDRWLAGLVGLWLLLDLTWADQNRKLLVESLFMSLHVLSLAVFVWHYQRRREPVPAWSFVAAGVLYTLAFVVRPSGILLVVVAVVGYRLMFWRRGAARALLVLMGVMGVVVVFIGFNFTRYGEPRLFGRDGYTVMSSLYGYHHFDPAHGAASAQLDTLLRACLPDVDYDDVPRYYANLFIFGNYGNCIILTQAQTQHDTHINRALFETVLADPFAFGRSVLQDTLSYIAHPMGYYVEYDNANSRALCQSFGLAWCADYTQPHAPTPVDDAAYYLSFVNQIYLPLGEALSLDRPRTGHYIREQPITSEIQRQEGLVIRTVNHDVAYFGLFVLFSLWLWRIPRQRVLVLLSLVVIGYVLFITSLVHVYLARYGVVLTPFYALLSALAVRELLPWGRMEDSA
ncbi:MAG: hypothetical protein ACLFTK_12570 [Anaerolineales bacterium]